MVEESIEELLKHFPEDKFILKMLEECAELSEVLLKYLTKSPERKPPMEKIIEELGDVMFRAKALAKKMDIEKQVDERMEEKAELLINWVKTF